MRWCVLRHPDTGGLAVVAESAVPVHRQSGWVRVSEYRRAPEDLRIGDFVDAPPLDDDQVDEPPAGPVDVADTAPGAAEAAQDKPPAKPARVKET